MEIDLIYPDGSRHPIKPINKEDLCKSNIRLPEYTFKDGQCFGDGEVVGSILSQSEKEILVKCYDGNPYMAGHVLKFVIHS